MADIRRTGRKGKPWLYAFSGKIFYMQTFAQAYTELWRQVMRSNTWNSVVFTIEGKSFTGEKWDNRRKLEPSK